MKDLIACELHPYQKIANTFEQKLQTELRAETRFLYLLNMYACTHCNERNRRLSKFGTK